MAKKLRAMPEVRRHTAEMNSLIKAVENYDAEVALKKLDELGLS